MVRVSAPDGWSALSINAARDAARGGHAKTAILPIRALTPPEHRSYGPGGPADRRDDTVFLVTLRKA